MPSDIVGPATLSITSGMSAFQFFLPKLSDVRKADAVKNPEMVGDVRMGEVAGITLCVGIGVIVSSLTGSSVPAVVAVIMATILVFVYESALRGDRPWEPRTGLERSEDA